MVAEPLDLGTIIVIAAARLLTRLLTRFLPGFRAWRSAARRSCRSVASSGSLARGRGRARGRGGLTGGGSRGVAANLRLDRPVLAGAAAARSRLGKQLQVTERDASAISIRNPVNDRVKRELRWAPQTSLQDGVAELLEYFREGEK